MISFIVSTYNRPDNLRVLLYSLMAQTRKDFEVLVMDEGDNGVVVAAVNDDRFRHYPLQRVEAIVSGGGNGSLGLLPKHTGVSHAKGDYLCFPSDDIYYLPTFVQHMSDRDKDIVGCDLIVNTQHETCGLGFFPAVGYTDSANYIIRPEVYARHPFPSYLPPQERWGKPWTVEEDKRAGVADGLVPFDCVKDGATWERVPRILAVHGVERAS